MVPGLAVRTGLLAQSPAILKRTHAVLEVFVMPISNTLIIIILYSVLLLLWPFVMRHTVTRWRDTRSKYSFWSVRFTLLCVLSAVLFGTLFTDLYDKGLVDSPQMAHSIKAPIYGLVTAGILVTFMIQGRTTVRSNTVNDLLRQIGVIAASLTGWSWLSSVTGNDPWPLLIAIAPFAALIAIPGVLFHLTMTYLGRPERRGDEN